MFGRVKAFLLDESGVAPKTVAEIGLAIVAAILVYVIWFNLEPGIKSSSQNLGNILQQQ